MGRSNLLAPRGQVPLLADGLERAEVSLGSLKLCMGQEVLLDRVSQAAEGFPVR
jgi:hypothetical protein